MCSFWRATCHQICELQRFVSKSKSMPSAKIGSFPIVSKLSSVSHAFRSSMKFPPNAIIYEQLLYHTFNLLGIGSRLERSSFKAGDRQTQTMQASTKHIVVDASGCLSSTCNKSCDSESCWLCLHCMNSYQLFDLLEAYREHTNKGDMKRIFPKPIVSTDGILLPQSLLSILLPCKASKSFGCNAKLNILLG